MNKLIFDMNLLSKYNVLSNFCLKQREAWMEQNHLFITGEFCKYGDMSDYLGKLEDNNFIFTDQFYWDLIFEMICVSYFIFYDFRELSMSMSVVICI